MIGGTSTGPGPQARGRGRRGRQRRLPGAAALLLPCLLGLLLSCGFREASCPGALALSSTGPALLQEAPAGAPGAPRGDLYAALGVPRGARPEGLSAGLIRAALEWWQGEGRCAEGAPAGIGRALEVRLVQGTLEAGSGELRAGSGRLSGIFCKKPSQGLHGLLGWSHDSSFIERIDEGKIRFSRSSDVCLPSCHGLACPVFSAGVPRWNSAALPSLPTSL